MNGWQALATFTLAVVPGVIVLEIFEAQRPRLKERGGLRTVAHYLIISAFVWTTAIVVLNVHHHLASVIDSINSSGEAQVSAYIAVAWRLGVAAAGIGLVARGVFSLVQRAAYKLERNRQGGGGEAGGRFGGALIQLVSISYAWDALMQRLRRKAKAQVVHVQLKDGSAVYGVLAAGGFADFQSEGRGLVLDVQLLEERGRLVEVRGSSGIFIVPESVATVAFLDFPEGESGGKVQI